jgi:energy-coupling factor transport system ATP-binding protein
VTGPEADEIARERLAALGLSALKDQSVFKLSEGQKQKAVLAALTALRPKLLLLDEPSANLDPVFLEELKKALWRLREDGLALIVADHRPYWLKGLCRKLLVLDDGAVAYEGQIEDLADPERRSRLGLRSPDVPKEPNLPLPLGFRRRAPDKEAGFNGTDDSDRAAESGREIRIENLYFNYPGGPELFGGLSLALGYGEVAALTGPSGRGKTTLARLLCGLEKPVRGRITYDGQPAGLELAQVVLQNSDHQLYMPTVLSEVILAVGEGGRTPEVEARARELLASFGLLGLAARHPQSLSGGEKQRLVVALGLARPTKLLALDEPTSGLDGQNLLLMAAQITKAAQAGPAVLVVTHDLELVGLCAGRHLELLGPMA